MIVKDEESLEEAILLVAQGPVRYSDQYAYIIVTTPETLELNVRRAFGREDIAIVCPRGQERSMEEHDIELRKVKEQRRVQEKKAVKAFFTEHPEKVEKIRKYAAKRGRLGEKEEE